MGKLHLPTEKAAQIQLKNIRILLNSYREQIQTREKVLAELTQLILEIRQVMYEKKWSEE